MTRCSRDVARRPGDPTAFPPSWMAGMPAGLLSLILLGISAGADSLPDPPDELVLDSFTVLDAAPGPALLPGKEPVQKPPRHYPRLRAHLGGNGSVSPRNPKGD